MSCSGLPSQHSALCAGGTTACVVAGRLAASDSSLKILILEGGQHTLNEPAYVQPYRYLGNKGSGKTVYVGNPSPRLNGRTPSVSCGHCVGGGSCVNGS